MKRLGFEAPTSLRQLGGRCSFGRIAATIDAVMSIWSNRNLPLAFVVRAIAAAVEARRLAADRLGNTSTPSGVSTS